MVVLPGGPAVTVERLSSVGAHGIDVHLLGLSDKGRLVHACFSDGNITTTVEPSDVFDSDSMATWSRNYPSGFALMDHATRLEHTLWSM